MSGLLKAVATAVGSAIVESETGGQVINTLLLQTPEYQEYQRNVQEYALRNEMIAMAGMTTSVTFFTLGLCFSLAGRNGLGSGLIVVAVPTGFFSYNSNIIYENMKNDFAEKIVKHLAVSKDPKKIKIDPKKLRACLLKGTICYDLLVNFHVSYFMATYKAIKLE